MRLELEQQQNHSSSVYSQDMPFDGAAEDRSAEAAGYLREGIKHAQAGNRSAARTALVKASELDPRNESTWLWLSSISEYPEELLAFLSRVLDLNPQNARALEWSAATRSLMAKNLVQRGIDAIESDQPENAVQHFEQALELDERNSLALLWLASAALEHETKLAYFEKVLEFEPENEAANVGRSSAKGSIKEGRLSEARSAAVSGELDRANQVIDALLSEDPNAEDVWMLKSHIAPDIRTRIECFERIVEINPDNAAAQANLDSLAWAAAGPSEPDVEADGGHEAAGEDDFTCVDASENETAWEDAWKEDESNGPSAEMGQFDEPVPFVQEDLPQFVSECSASADQPAENFVAVDTANDNGSAPVDEPVDGGLSSFSGEFRPDEFVIDDDAVSEVTDHGDAVSFDTSDTGPEEITYELAAEEPELADEQIQESGESSAEASEFSGAWETEGKFESSDGEALEDIGFAKPSNPFDAMPAENDNDAFKTLVSIDIDPETLAAVQNYDITPSGPSTGSAGQSSVFDAPFDVTMIGANIPMPGTEFATDIPSPTTGFETNVVSMSSNHAEPESGNSCPFCLKETDPQSISCNNCLAVLTLADLELILANHNADKYILRHAVESMEKERLSRDLGENELTMLGIGHLNLRNLQFGYNSLHEASQMNPNNVVLAGQVNALLIRLEEIKLQAEAHEAMSKGKKILVVDDSPTVRKLIAGKLEKCGHEVHCSSDGVEAMEQLEQIRPDLVLLDINMPRMDGYQVCKLIRSKEETKDVPVVMISGKDGFFDKVRGRMAGTSGFITKPFGPETLMKAVESFLAGEV